MKQTKNQTPDLSLTQKVPINIEKALLPYKQTTAAALAAGAAMLPPFQLKSSQEDDFPEYLCFKNDYVFTETMQNKKVLLGFLGCLTGIDIDSVEDIEVLPRHLRKNGIRQKLGILDIRLRLKNQKRINIELQITRFEHWNSRSLFYNCKMLTDQYKTGNLTYSNIDKCIHIGILDFNFTDDPADFYSIYTLRDARSGRQYTDLLEFHTIQLKKRSHPSVKKEYEKLYLWTELFYAKSWKELMDLAAQNEFLAEAVKEIDELNMDEYRRDEAFYRMLEDMDEATRREDEKKRLEDEKRRQMEFEKRQKEFEKQQKEFEDQQKEFEDQQNMINAAADMTRKNLVSHLTRQYSPLPASIIDTINNERDLSALLSWMQTALETSSLQTFLQSTDIQSKD